MRVKTETVVDPLGRLRISQLITVQVSVLESAPMHCYKWKKYMHIKVHAV